MSVIATAVKHLLAAGVTGDALVAAIADMEANTPAPVIVEAGPSKAALRQRRYAERQKASSDVIPDVSDAPPPNDIYSNPPPVSSEASPPSRQRASRSAFPKPDWADAQVWTDFLANRQRKRLPNTATAHRKLIADIDRITDDSWPPGRILEMATGKGWGAIYPSIKNCDDEDRNGNRPTNDQSEPQNAMVRAVRRAEARGAGHDGSSVQPRMLA